MSADSFWSFEKVTMAQVASKLGVSRCSVWRWYLRGVGGHRLRTIKLAGRRYVRIVDLDEFLAATNGEKVSDKKSPSFDRRVEIAEKKLSERGI